MKTRHWVLLLAAVLAAGIYVYFRYPRTPPGLTPAIKDFSDQKLKSGSYPLGEDEDVEELLDLLKDYGGIGDIRGSGKTALQLHQETTTMLHDKFDEDPEKFLKNVGDLLDEEPGEFETEKFMALHTLTKLPIAQTAPAIKVEIERELPDPAEEDPEFGDATTQAIARKIAGIEALARHDPDYLLDSIADPDTNAAVKRAAVESYILSDDNRQAAITEVRALLAPEELYMLRALEQNVPDVTIKNYFLGLDEDTPAPTPSGKKKAVKKKVK